MSGHPNRDRRHRPGRGDSQRAAMGNGHVVVPYRDKLVAPMALLVGQALAHVEDAIAGVEHGLHHAQQALLARRARTQLLVLAHRRDEAEQPVTMSNVVAHGDDLAVEPQRVQLH